jgi:predicted ATP-grasp superfamily ATP-dependent carboligase
MDLTYWMDLLRPTFAEKKVIIAVEMAAPAAQTTRNLQGLGATEVLVVATNGVGLGESPEEAGAKVIVLNTPAEGTRMVRHIQACQSAVRNLPSWVVDEINTFDPDHAAIAIGDFLTENDAVAGRPFVFHRRPEWVALDDKTTIDALWDRAGVPRSPSTVVAAEANAITACFEEYDQGNGVVIAIDSSDGWTGGGEGVKWVRTRADVSETLGSWADGSRRVRVMPFLEGIPCSIHGVVFDDYVMALRPVEMIVLRKPNGEFFYAGCASYFDPPSEDREAMRALAKQVGAHLRTEVGFRGAFTIDGVMTTEGFRPTELNPRNGAGMATMARALDGPLLMLINFVSAEMSLDWKPADLEDAVLSAVDDLRAGGTWRTLQIAADVPEVAAVTIDESGDVQLVAEATEADLTFVTQLSEGKVFVRALWNHDRTRKGPATAPRAAAFWKWADKTYALEIGDLAPASNVR